MRFAWARAVARGIVGAREIARSHVHRKEIRSMPTLPTFRPTTPLRLVLAAALAAPSAVALAGAPHYHLEPIAIPGAQGIYAYDINDAGQVVGYYLDENFVNRAFVYDASGAHTLALPVIDNTEVDAQATAINNAGQIVGSVQVFDLDTATVVQAPGALWDAADPSTYTLIEGDSAAIALTPADINNNGAVVGLKGNLETGEAFHGFVWTKEGGVVDYGTTDTFDPSINASWSAVNDAGQLVGVWNFQFAVGHAAVGTVGTPEMLPMSAASDAVESGAVAINASGTRVGYMDLDASGNRVPVVFDAAGNATAIEGATLGLPRGQAIGINDAGVIVGRADDFSTLTFKAFVAIDGVAYDVLNVADGDGGFGYLLTAQAVNSSGVIVGLARVGDSDVGSYILTPIADDAVFANGFDPQ
jgi:probable HAF family extracellular repeat protein